MDDFSRAICGYMLFLGASSAMNTALALRQAIWPKARAEWPMWSSGFFPVVLMDRDRVVDLHRRGGDVDTAVP